MREAPHVAATSERLSLIVGMDYMFVTPDGVSAREELKGVSYAKVLSASLVIKYSHSESLFAHVVPQTGLDPQRAVVDVVVEDIKWLGCARVILKSDNEPALVRVLREALKTLRVESVVQACDEHPPQYDPQSN